MSEYLHGAYGQIQTAGSRAAEDDGGQGAFVYIGTAPVNQVEGGAANVNKPIVVHNIAEARKCFGYSDDWASFTLCEAMHVHLELNGVGPLVLINVLDPAKHKEENKITQSLAPANGRIIITVAEKVWLDSLEIEGKEKGEDYTVAYNADKQQIVIQEVESGALGTEALSVSFELVKPEGVTAADVIGESDGLGLNTGIFAVKNVYNLTGYIPAYLAAPGFSSLPEVNTALNQNSLKAAGHWFGYVFADLPIVDGDGTALTMATAAEWKAANGYIQEGETAYFPMIEGVDGNYYHISVLSAANLQALLLEYDGIPWHTASNTECSIIKNLYMGEDNAGRVYDVEIINKYLNANGIASAAFVGGRWAIWGCHSADYSQENAGNINVAETNRMMLNYIVNDFQHRHAADVDKPMSMNDIQAVVAEEQTRLDALLKIGALTYGVVSANATADDMSDLIQGDYSFSFKVTTTPLCKSMTAIVNWTDDGYAVYFAAESDTAA